MRNEITFALLVIVLVFCIPLGGWLFMMGVDYVFSTEFSVELVSWRSVVAGLLLMALNSGGSR